MPVTLRGSGQTPVQMVQVTNTSQSTISAGANTEVAVTGMSASITPTNSANRILITLQLSGSATSNTWKAYFRRNGTQIYVGTNPLTNQQVASIPLALVTDGNQAFSYCITFLDSPATTSAVTYTLFAIGDNSQTFYINRSVSNLTSNTGGSYASSLTLQEIAYA